MARARSDKPIREQAQRAAKRLRSNTREYAWLDDWRSVAETDRLKIKKQLEIYINKTKGIILNGIIDETAIRKIISAARAKFSGIGGKPADIDRLTESVLAEYRKSISENIDTIHRNAETKIGLFKAKMDEISALPEVSNLEMAGRVSYIPEITIGGRAITGGDPGKLWEILSKNYGGIETVTYRNGAKVPLNSYMDMKTLTMATDIQSTAVTVETAQRGLFCVRISDHSATDSCRLHEGEVCFVSDFARSQFLEKFGDKIPVAKTWHTIDEIKRDKSHIFLPNCRHTVDPYAPEILPDSLIAELPKGRPLAKSTREATALAANY